MHALLLQAFLKAEENVYLRRAPQKGHQWSWAHLSLLLVLNKWSLLQEIPLFIRIYRVFLMDTWIHLLKQKKNGAEAVSSLIMSLLKSRVPDTFSDTLCMWGRVGLRRRMACTGCCPDTGLLRALWPSAAPCAATLRGIFWRTFVLTCFKKFHLLENRENLSVN